MYSYIRGHFTSFTIYWLYTLLLTKNIDLIFLVFSETKCRSNDRILKINKNQLTIIPQKFSFEKPTIKNGKGETISHGISVTIDIDAFKANKTEIKKDLTAIFAEVLEYFD